MAPFREESESRDRPFRQLVAHSLGVGEMHVPALALRGTLRWCEAVLQVTEDVFHRGGGV